MWIGVLPINGESIESAPSVIKTLTIATLDKQIYEQ